jgi:hypothetical protein
MATTALKCDLCGGKLQMGAGGIATCDSCGMEHSMDRMKEKVQEVTGTVRVEGAVSVSGVADIEANMKRARIFLKDEKWNDARTYFNKVLDLDPEYAPAYVGILCVEIEIKTMEDLKNLKPKKYINTPNFQKAIDFADEKLKETLNGYIDLYKEKQKKKYSSLFSSGSNLEEKKAALKQKQDEENMRVQAENERLKGEVEKHQAEIEERYQNEIREWQKQVNNIKAQIYKIAEQSNEWLGNGLCPHCGGKKKLFSNVCKLCGKDFSSAILLPKEPDSPSKPYPFIYTPTKPTVFRLPVQLNGKMRKDGEVIINIGGLDWLVLDIKKDAVLLITYNLLDCGSERFQSPAKKSVSWESCSLYHYLNGEFLKKLPNEITDLLQDKGNGKIFLLDNKEAKKYFADASDRIAYPKNSHSADYWWLRGPIENSDYTNLNLNIPAPPITTYRVRGSSVDSRGSISEYTKISQIRGDSEESYTERISMCIRPAMWVKQ